MSELAPISPTRTWADGGLPLVLVALALLLPLVLMFSGTLRGDHSSRSQGPDGSAAFSAVLEGLGHPVEQLGVGLLPLRFEEPGSVLFMPLADRGSGADQLSTLEQEMLARFVAAGSSLVLVTSHEADVLSAFDLKLESRGRPAQDVSPTESGAEEAPPVFLRPEAFAGVLQVEGEAWVVPSAEDEILFGFEGFPVAAQRRVGEGQVLLVSDPSTLSNRGLSRGSNLEFYVGFVDRWLGPSGRVLFDDLHAGGGSERGIVAYARKAGLLPMLLLVVLLVVLYLWRASTRFGAVQSADEGQEGRAETERIQATAGLYERASLYRYGLLLSSRHFRRLLESRSGTDWDSERLRAWVEREWGAEAGLQFDRIRTGLTLLLAQEQPDPRSCRTAAGAIYNFEERYLPGRVSSDRHG